ncbi:endothelin-converting enzyme 2-like isoform X1 [Pomacea canaliculata]|uniref:endothelin-converting enzyme 2-like isoform X1 n=1 Tax=Pomacea canaliculata TaxID=400727 RepID=UPI000D7292B7|nr:endothelin-converting enzyme 2-like isoform X1 [Pomacea canaliculata]
MLLVIFFGLFIAFCVKYDEKNGSTEFVSTFVPSENVCQTFECLESAATIAKSINTSVDPCDNFYQFACGRWMAEYPVPLGSSRINNFILIGNEITQTLKGLLTIQDETAPEAVKQARAYFRSCQDADTREKEGSKPVLDLFNLSGSGIYPTLQPSWNDTGMTFSDIVEYLANVGDLGTSVFTPMLVMQDEMQSDRNIIRFSQTDLILPARESYFTERNSTEMMLYESVYAQVLEALGANATTAAKDAKDVVDFEIELAYAIESPEKRLDKAKLYHRMTIADLTTMFPQFAWLRYIQSQFKKLGVDYNITKDEMVANDALTYYTNLFTLVNQTSKRTLLNYGMWRQLCDFLGYLGPKFTKIVKEAIGEPDEVCVVHTQTIFQYAVGRLYVDSKFSSQDKLRMTRMIESLMKTFKEMLQENTWMTQATRDEALKKLSYFTVKVGYPDFILNDTALNEKTSMYNVVESHFFGTYLDIAKKSYLLMLKSLREPVDKTAWGMAAFEVNAYYRALNNEIVFPAGISNPPFYSSGISDALLYGGIGTIIGHEITHGFDSQGSAYDEKGNLRQWWQDVDLNVFKSRTQCLVDQYSQFAYSSLNMTVNGKLTLGENIADCGGIREAFRAYRSVIKERGQEEDKYPTLPYTQDQLFFIGFAQSWCSLVTAYSLRTSLLTDVHSPNDFRVMGSIQNSDDFGRVFNCSVGKPMNPQHKCQVW